MSGIGLEDLKLKMTSAERVALQLAAEIVSGALPVGMRLDEKQQSIRLGVSRTPLREALCYLVAIGLAHSKAHCGVSVAAGVRESLAEMVENVVRWRVERLLDAKDVHACRSLALMIESDPDWVSGLVGTGDNSIARQIGATLWLIFLESFGRHLRSAMLAPARVALAAAIMAEDRPAVRRELSGYFTRMLQCLAEDAAA